MKGAAHLQSWKSCLRYETKVCSHSVMPVLTRLLSLCCRLGAAADPHAGPRSTAAVALTDNWRYRSEWEGCKGGCSRCWIQFHWVLMEHTLTHTAWFLILSTSPFLWEDTDTPWMGPRGDLHCGWEVPSLTTAMMVFLKGQCCWSCSCAGHVPLSGLFKYLCTWMFQTVL